MKITDERASEEIEFVKIPMGAVFKFLDSDQVHQKVSLLCLDKLASYAIHLQSGSLVERESVCGRPCILLNAELVIK